MCYLIPLNLELFLHFTFLICYFTGFEQINRKICIDENLELAWVEI